MEEMRLSISGMTCSGCSNAVCGNGAVEAGEECDDSNTSSGDGCSSSCLWEHTCTADNTIVCGQTYNNVNGVSGSDVSGYSCNGWNTGSERVYAFTALTSGTVTADISDCDFDADYDLYIMEGACNPNLCIDHGTSGGCDSITFSVTAGVTYYMAVEEYWIDFDDNFDFDLSCP